MSLVKKFSYLLIIFLFAGCSFKGVNIKKQPNTAVSKSQLITLKTKRFAFSDSGFYKSDDKKVLIQAYSSGVGIGEIQVYKTQNLVCVKRYCNTKEWFNENFLSKYYPKDLILNVLEKKPIFDGKNLTKTKDGFVQKIGSIKYKVTKSEVFFKDLKNRIIIRLRDLKK